VEHGVDNTDRAVSDPLHDIAAASVGFRLDPKSEARLVEGYAAATNDRDRLRARLAFHKLMAGVTELEAIANTGYEPGSRVQREAMARDLVDVEQVLTRSVNGYLADLYLSDSAGRETGDIWALDLDDTLEMDWLGFQATSPAGALALRALAAHDQLVLASTGRSLAEVQDRCETYRIAGGIAEYGAVAWDARNHRVLTTIADESRRSLETLRDAILEETDIVADPRYEHTLRLFRNTPDGRRGMKTDEIAEVIGRHRIEGLEIVEGYRKTVVQAAGCDKARALLPLLRSLGVDRASRRFHVVGDEFTDLGLMTLADRRHAPGNASDALREGGDGLSLTVAKRGHGAGVLEIVRRELHRTGGRCALCKPAQLDRGDAAFVEVLGVQDRARVARFAYALHPASLRAFEL
jgi:hydroxymethylpyrimidine pyrophosphatase-like HAD family hydrolase